VCVNESNNDKTSETATARLRPQTQWTGLAGRVKMSESEQSRRSSRWETCWPRENDARVPPFPRSRAAITESRRVTSRRETFRRPLARKRGDTPSISLESNIRDEMKFGFIRRHLRNSELIFRFLKFSIPRKIAKASHRSSSDKCSLFIKKNKKQIALARG